MMKNKQYSKFSIFISSLIVWSTVGLLAVFYSILAIFLMPISVKKRLCIIKSWGNVYAFLVKHLCHVEYQITGMENIIKEPCVIASNHQSTLENTILVSFLPPHVWIIKKELFWVPFFGWGLFMIGPIAINRAKGSLVVDQIISSARVRIKQGISILVYPEGTRVSPDVVKPFKTGVAKLSKALNLPVMPIAHNAGRLLPRAGFLINPGVVKVVVDKPIYPQENESVEDYTQRIEDVVRKNLIIIK
jgi:1-acyl-sn-glycerol-3-phosphate acyltransferase